MKFLIIALLFSCSYKVSALSIVFLNPSVPGTPFWDQVTDVAYGAASSLGIELEVVYGKGNRIFHHQALEKIAARKHKPDYLIFSPYGGAAEQNFAMLKGAQINFVTIERTLHQKEKVIIGSPQQNNKYWLGEVYHNNFLAGRLLATYLFNQAKLLNKNSKEYNTQLKVVGLSGGFSGESDHRTEGFIQAAKSHHVEVLQVVSAGWSREKSRPIFFQLLERYGDVDVVWCASDGMALGVNEALTSGWYNRQNKALIIGGIDWLPEAIKSVSNKELTATVGGHFMQTAWAMVKIFDHHNGEVVFDKHNNASFELEAIHKGNVVKYIKLANKVNWEQVDFKRFSLHLSKKKGTNENPTYDFNIDRIIEQLP